MTLESNSRGRGKKRELPASTYTPEEEARLTRSRAISDAAFLQQGRRSNREAEYVEFPSGSRKLELRVPSYQQENAKFEHDGEDADEIDRKHTVRVRAMIGRLKNDKYKREFKEHGYQGRGNPIFAVSVHTKSKDYKLDLRFLKVRFPDDWTPDHYLTDGDSEYDTHISVRDVKGISYSN